MEDQLIPDDYDMYPPETRNMSRGEYLAFMRKKAAMALAPMLQKREVK